MSKQIQNWSHEIIEIDDDVEAAIDECIERSTKMWREAADRFNGWLIEQKREEVHRLEDELEALQANRASLSLQPPQYSRAASCCHICWKKE